MNYAVGTLNLEWDNVEKLVDSRFLKSAFKTVNKRYFLATEKNQLR